VVYAFRRKKEHAYSQGPPVNVYVKKPKPKSAGWTQFGTALVAALSAKATEGIRTTITNSFSDEFHASSRAHCGVTPNPKLRDVQI
jgi:hypothetical protein